MSFPPSSSEPEEDGQPRLRWERWRLPRTYIGPAVILIGAVIVYPGTHSGPQTNPQSGQQGNRQQQGTAANGPDAANPIVLARPPFDYYLAGQPGADSKVRLKQVSLTDNQITDEDEWFKKNRLALPTLTVPNPSRQEPGNIPASIPTRRGDDILIKAINQGDDLLCIYGHDFSLGRYLTSFNLSSGKVNFAFDFHNFMPPPRHLPDENDVDERVMWAQVKDNVLYVSTGNGGYAKNTYGQDAYLNAIDLKDGRLLWRSQPLVSNSSDFLLYQDAIITGYGFSMQQHFLYVVNQSDGRIVQTIPIRKMADYIRNRGDVIYVRTYDADYVFKATEQ